MAPLVAALPEGLRRQHGATSVTEMLLMIRRFFHSSIYNAPMQQRFLSGRALAVKALAEDIAGENEHELGPHVDDYVNE